jgi:hypothetical protein
MADMNKYEEFTLKEHIIDFFNQNAEYFNNPKSEEKVFATERVGRMIESLPDSGDGGEFPEFADTSVKLNKPFPLVFTEKIELPVMENPKYFFRFCAHKQLEELFARAPESAAKLGTRPWKYILRYSPEFVSQCPCLKKFSAEEKALILHHQKQLAQYL